MSQHPDILLILSDIDGTLLPFGQRVVSQRVLDSFHTALDSGIHVGPASGRGISHVTPSFAGDAACTAIFYLLRGSSFSHLHRLSGDELYHFYLGDPVELTELLPDGSVRTTTLGSGITHGECLQHLVPAGNWQGSRLKEGGSWALLGTTMCPGYRQDMYEHGDRAKLLRQYPSERDSILRLTGDVRY